MLDNLMNSNLPNIVWIILAVGAGWILLRFIFKLARRIFAFGCFAILILGVILIASQFFKGF